MTSQTHPHDPLGNVSCRSEGCGAPLVFECRLYCCHMRWPWGSYFVSLESQSLLCKMRVRTVRYPCHEPSWGSAVCLPHCLMRSQHCVNVSDVALTSVAQSVGHHPAKRKATSSIPGQGTFLGRRLVPSSVPYKKQGINAFLSLPRFFPSLSPSLPLSLKIHK